MINPPHSFKINTIRSAYKIPAILAYFHTPRTQTANSVAFLHDGVGRSSAALGHRPLDEFFRCLDGAALAVDAVLQ